MLEEHGLIDNAIVVFWVDHVSGLENYEIACGSIGGDCIVE